MNSLTNSVDLNPRNLLLLALFLAVVIGVGAFIGVNVVGGRWYAGLEKPVFHPPAWVFSRIWFALYVLIAIAGWRIALAAPDGRAMKLWFGQMILNWLWAPTWFGLHLMWPALALIVTILAMTLCFIWVAWKTDRIAAALFVPYSAWLAFSTALNLSIVIMN